MIQIEKNYEDIEEVSNKEGDVHYITFDYDEEIQENIGDSNNVSSPFQFLSPTWYILPLKAYTFMIQYIQGEIISTWGYGCGC